MNKVAQLVDYLANMHKALSLSPSNTNPRHSSNVSVIQHSGGPRGHDLLSLCNPSTQEDLEAMASSTTDQVQGT